MSLQSSPQRTWPIGLLLLLAVAGVLYGLMLANAMDQTSGGGGEDRMGQGFAALFLTAGLWIVLTIMIIVGGVSGAMPGWAGALAGLLIPTSAVANVIAIDMCSRNMPWAIVFPAVLAPLIASYAFWARLPRLQAVLPAERTSVAIWGSIFFLSVATFVLAA